jgi:hypothetical protein
MPHPLFQAPSPDTKIWRYTDLAKFMAMLEHRALYVSNLLALAESDPYEGHFPDGQVAAFAELSSMPIPEVRKLLNLDDKTDDDAVRWICETNLTIARGFDWRRGAVYVNCWHMNSSESDAMWRLYTLQGQGIAVQSTYDRLVRCFHMSLPRVEIGKVEYRDYSTHAISLNNVYAPALCKRDSFQHERELRVATLQMSPRNREMLDRKVDSTDGWGPPPAIPDGYPIEVDIDILIERVVVSPKSPGWMVELIRNLLRRYGVSKPVEWSPLYTLNRAPREP